jgi:hypothetical protein
LKVEFHPSAGVELIEAIDWYNDQVPGLGDALLAESSKKFRLIAEAPFAWPLWPMAPSLYPPVRRILTARFQYAIPYQAFSDRDFILAFAHTSRDPFFWIDRAEI